MTINLIETRELDKEEPSRRGQAELPLCEFKLRTEKGMAIYERLARLLFDAGKLTAEMHLRLSRYALAADTIHAVQAQGGPLRASMFDQLRRAEKDLGLEDIARPAAPPEPLQPNKFARCGFSSRQRRTP